MHLSQFTFFEGGWPSAVRYTFWHCILDERSMKDRYVLALSNSKDSEVLLEQANLNQYRKGWLQKGFPVKDLNRYVDQVSIVEKCLQ